MTSKLLRNEILDLGRKLKVRLEQVSAKLADDPMSRYIAASDEFQAWLEKTTGPARCTEEAIAYTNVLNARAKRAMKELKARDDFKLMDEKIELEQAICEWNQLAFSLRLTERIT